MNSAAKVGLLLVVFIGLLVAAFSVLGRSLFRPADDVYYSVLPDAGGVAVGTAILMAGVPVGTVSKVDLQDPRTARLTLAVKARQPIPDGTFVRIPTSLVGIGSPTVELIPPDQTTAVLAPGATLPGRKGSPLESILPGGGKETIGELNKTMAAVRKLLEDQRLRTSIDKLLATTNKTIETSQATLKNFADLAASGNDLIARNQSTISDILVSTRGTLVQVQSTAQTLAKFVREGKIQGQAVAILEKVSKIEDQAQHLLASFDKTVNDPQIQANLHSMTKNAADTSARGPAIADNAQKVSENLAVITERSKDLPLKIGEIADKASKLEDQLSGLVDKVGGVFGKKPSAGSLNNLQTTMDLMRESHPGYWRTDLGARLPISDGNLDLGLYDAFESNRISVQFGKDLAKGFAYRYGIYASKPGVGVDYSLGSRFSLRNDFWNINHPRLDSRFRYDFGNGLVGWIGVDRLLHDNAPTFGIGIRR